MKVYLNWLSKSLLLPLVPFMIGLLIQYYLTETFNFSSMDPLDLSFSMAMLSVFVLLGLKNISDNYMKETFSIIYILFIGAFFASFGILKFINIEIIEKKDLIISSAKIITFTSVPKPMDASPFIIDEFLNMINIIRKAIIMLSVIVIIFSLLIKWKYNLQEDNLDNL